MNMEFRWIARLAGVTIDVPTVDETSRFLRDTLEFGPIPGAAGGSAFLLPGEYGSSGPRRVLTLRPGDGPALAGLTFEVRDRPALKELAEALTGRGIEVSDLGEDEDGGPGIGFEDPFGVTVACRLDRDEPTGQLPPSDVRPRRLGHANLKVPDAAAAAAFYTEALGLRLTERIGDFLQFLRVGSDHHNLGFRSGAERADVHHVAFEVKGWEDFRTLCDRLADRGYKVEYGPGRHAPGHNLFVYLRDPASGLRLEMFADMAQIADNQTYEPISWQPADRSRTVNLWGPAPPTSFLE